MGKEEGMNERETGRETEKRPQSGQTHTDGDTSGYSRIKNSSVCLKVSVCVGETKLEPDCGRSRMPG